MSIAARFLSSLFVCLFVPFSVVANAGHFIDGLPQQKPKQILVDNHDRFYLDFSSLMAIQGGGKLKVIKFKDPDDGFRNHFHHNLVTEAGTVYSLFKSYKFVSRGLETTDKLMLASCENGVCDYETLLSWSRYQTETSYSISELNMGRDGELLYALTYHYKVDKKRKSSNKFYINKKEVNEAVYQSKLKTARSRDVVIDGGALNIGSVVFLKGGQRLSYEKERSSRYEHSIVYDQRGAPHLFFHNPQDRSFYHHFYDQEQDAVNEVVVDYGESGLENIAFVDGEAIWTVHYFYRDAFNKGLVATKHSSKSGAVLSSFIIDSSDRRNSGWELAGATSSNNRLLITYLSDSASGRREYVVLDNASQLESVLANNFQSYGHPRGEGYLPLAVEESPTEYITKLNRAYQQPLKLWSMNVGFGVQQMDWLMSSAQPSSSSAVVSPYSPEYTITDSMLAVTSIEGKLDGTSVALEVVSDDIESRSTGSNTTLNKLMGRIGWDSLIFNYDFSLQFESTSADILFSDTTNQAETKLFTTKFQEMKLSLLTLKRHHFGYIYQQYNSVQPIYIYKADQGDRSYHYHAKAIGSVDVRNHLFHYGYSTANYIAKYETSMRDWFIDGELRLGMSFADYKDDLLVVGSASPGNEYTAFMGGQLELGYIWYRRWSSLAQLGGYIKLSYRLDFSTIGDADIPDSLDSEASSDEYSYNFERTELRHGPLFLMAITF